MRGPCSTQSKRTTHRAEATTQLGDAVFDQTTTVMSDGGVVAYKTGAMMNQAGMR